MYIFCMIPRLVAIQLFISLFTSPISDLKICTVPFSWRDAWHFLFSYLAKYQLKYSTALKERAMIFNCVCNNSKCCWHDASVHFRRFFTFFPNIKNWDAAYVSSSHHFHDLLSYQMRNTCWDSFLAYTSVRC